MTPPSPTMEVRPLDGVDGVLLFVPTPALDERGFFCRTFDAQVARSAGLDPAAFVQDSVSRSRRGVVRGLHVRRGGGESKLVRCASGSIVDVVVDLRRSSPTFLGMATIPLDGDRQVTVHVPRGCAHGFQALSETADVAYRIDRLHDPTEDVTVRYDDPALGVEWPLPPSYVSAKDRAGLTLASALALLDGVRSVDGGRGGHGVQLQEGTAPPEGVEPGRVPLSSWPPFASP